MGLAAAQPILHVLDVPSYPSIIPALSLADQEVAERLHPRHRLEFRGDVEDVKWKTLDAWKFLHNLQL